MVSTTTNMGGASRTVSHKYDYDGRDIQLTFPDGEKVWTARDGLGRPKEMYQGALGSTATIMTAVSYYPSGELYYFARRFGDNSAYGYDGGGRLAMRADGFAGGIGDTRSDYLYNPAGQLASEARTNDDYAWKGSVAVAREYASNERTRPAREPPPAGSTAPVSSGNGPA